MLYLFVYLATFCVNPITDIFVKYTDTAFYYTPTIL